MGFLDNSGDIILDAVLTDVGRRRMAQGNFKISRFAVGDDEINYGLYDKNHVSGTAYYDLEVLQTPVMEAFSQTNAGINYGLMSLTATDVLYLPVLKVNSKPVVSDIVINNATYGPNIFYVADPSTATVEKLVSSSALGDQKYFAVSNQTDGPAILIEGGLDTTDLRGSVAGQRSYLTGKQLLDRYYYVYYDTRFFNGVLGPSSDSTFANTVDGFGTPVLSYELVRAPSISTDLTIEHYAAARANAPLDRVYFGSGYTTPDTSVSAIAGPRSNFLLLNFDVKTTLNVEFSRYGAESALFVDGNTYQYIDTTVYVQGASTGVSTQVAIRIIKYKP